jgi:glycerophosphoryl diester phosphodiesterase
MGFRLPLRAGVSQLVVAAILLFTLANAQASREHPIRGPRYLINQAQLGPRPFYLVEDMDSGILKAALQQCRKGPFYRTNFSIGHRGAPLQFPEHTRESYVAAARMGAGIVECDVTFTRDRELVCRHSQCDLHTTTDILARPQLAAKCRQPFTPANPVAGTPASAMCCASDITLTEFKSLCGKMDASDPAATSVEQYLKGTPGWRTDLYASCGTVLSHRESIELFKSLGVRMTPELKSPGVPMPFQGEYTQQDYAQHLIDEYRAAGVRPENVFMQSFSLDDIKYWIEREPLFGNQAVYLDARVESAAGYAAAVAGMEALAAQGVKIVAPPIFALLTLDADNNIVPSDYAVAAKNAGLYIIAWSLERSGPLNSGGDNYYKTVAAAINNDGDMMTVLHVLARDVGVMGVFSDWPATVTYYANCMGLK